MKRAPITKGQAIREVVTLYRPERQPTKGEFQRLIRAFELLGLAPSEMLEACRQLDFVGSDGSLRHKGLEQLAPWHGNL
jgi:hypothetical protein